MYRVAQDELALLTPSADSAWLPQAESAAPYLHHQSIGLDGCPSGVDITDLFVWTIYLIFFAVVSSLYVWAHVGRYGQKKWRTGTRRCPDRTKSAHPTTAIVIPRKVARAGAMAVEEMITGRGSRTSAINVLQVNARRIISDDWVPNVSLLDGSPRTKSTRR